MRKVVFGLFILMFFQIPFAMAETANDQDIDRLFQDLKQKLITRTTPNDLLSPSLTVSQREKEAQRAVRPYVSVQFKYNMADLVRENTNEARLPLIVEWESAHAVGRLTGSAQLERVGGRWYFRDFGFMTFPWAIVVGMSSIGVAFAAVVLYFYKRSKNRQRQTIPA